MAKAKINSTFKTVCEGVMTFDEGIPVFEVDDIGTKTFEDVFKRFEGANVKVTVMLSEDGEPTE